MLTQFPFLPPVEDEKKKSIARDTQTWQVSTYAAWGSARAVDGNYAAKMALCAMTNNAQHAWWACDLRRSYQVKYVAVTIPTNNREFATHPFQKSISVKLPWTFPGNLGNIQGNLRWQSTYDQTHFECLYFYLNLRYSNLHFILHITTFVVPNFSNMTLLFSRFW